ncbi:MAG: YdcF family protein [Chloroflexota bacterium]
MFYLSKLIPLFLYPLGLAIVFLIILIVVDVWQRRWSLQSSLALMALLTLWVGGNHEVAHRLAHSLEKRHPPIAESTQAEVLVVLGGGVRPEIRPRQMPEFNERGDRVLHAAQLYRAGQAETILATGGYPPLFVGAHQRSEAEEMRELMIFMGVNEDDISLEKNALNTYENARNVAKMLDERDITRVILCTSAIHMPRAAAAFQKQGIEVIPAPADYFVTQSEDSGGTRRWFTLSIFYSFPQTIYLQVTTDSIKEYVGLLYYRTRGWI